ATIADFCVCSLAAPVADVSLLAFLESFAATYSLQQRRAAHRLLLRLVSLVCFLSIVRARPFAHVNPAGRGSGGALGETPNGLSASPSLPAAERQCQSYF